MKPLLNVEQGSHGWGLSFRLSTAVLSEATSEIEALGIEVKEYFVLDGVDLLPYPAQIAERLSISRPAVALHLRNLERKGLLQRAVEPTDLRRFRLSLTAEGRAVADEARQILSEKFCKRLDRLSAVEREAFSAILTTLVAEGRDTQTGDQTAR